MYKLCHNTQMCSLFWHKSSYYYFTSKEIYYSHEKCMEYQTLSTHGTEQEIVIACTILIQPMDSSLTIVLEYILMFLFTYIVMYNNGFHYGMCIHVNIVFWAYSFIFSSLLSPSHSHSATPLLSRLPSTSMSVCLIWWPS